MRIVEVEASLDAKSDDTLGCVRDGKKILSRCGFPSKQRPVLGRRKPRWQKKRKNGRFKIAQKIACWKRILSPVIRFLVCAEDGERSKKRDGAQILRET